MCAHYLKVNSLSNKPCTICPVQFNDFFPQMELVLSWMSTFLFQSILLKEASFSCHFNVFQLGVCQGWMSTTLFVFPLHFYVENYLLGQSLSFFFFLVSSFSNFDVFLVVFYWREHIAAFLFGLSDCLNYLCHD